MIACVLLPLRWLGSNPRVVCSGNHSPPWSLPTVPFGFAMCRRDPLIAAAYFARVSPRSSPRFERRVHEDSPRPVRHFRTHHFRDLPCNCDRCRSGGRVACDQEAPEPDDLPPLLHPSTADSCNSPDNSKLTSVSPTSTASPVTDPQTYSPPCVSWVSPPCSLRCHRDKHTAAPPESPIQSPIETSVETPRVLRSSKRRLLLPTVTGRSTRIQTARNLLWGNRRITTPGEPIVQHNSTTEQLPT